MLSFDKVVSLALCSTDPQHNKHLLASSVKMSTQLTDHMVYFQHALTACQDSGDGAGTEAIYTMQCTCSQSSEMYLDATDDLPVFDTPVSEQNDTLTFAASPSSLPSTSVYYSLLRSSENNPTKGYYVTKR